MLQRVGSDRHPAVTVHLLCSRAMAECCACWDQSQYKCIFAKVISCGQVEAKGYKPAHSCITKGAKGTSYAKAHTQTHPLMAPLWLSAIDNVCATDVLHRHPAKQMRLGWLQESLWPADGI